MQTFKHVGLARRRVKMSSNKELYKAVQLRLKLRGEWPPPRISAASMLQKWRDNNRHNPFDLDAILKEARAAGASLAEITRFRATPHDLQVEEILTTTNTAEPQLAEDEEESYLLREAQKREKWLAEKDRLRLATEQSRQQAERDRARYVAPIGSPIRHQPERTSTPDNNTNTPERPASRKRFNRLRRTESKEEWFESKEAYIEHEIKLGRKRKQQASSGEFPGWGDYQGRIQERALRSQQMSRSPSRQSTIGTSLVSIPRNHGSLVDRTRSRPDQVAMDSNKDTDAVAQLSHEMEKNLEVNTAAAGPAEVTNKPKKEKAPKQPKAPKAAPSTAPLTPALIDLRVGHILRAIEHPNADTMYVSTIAMGDPEGAEHTEIDEQTGKVVRTVCSGLKAYVKLEDMQDRKIVVVANLKPANLRSIKSAAMVLAASPKPEEGADSHAADRTVELVQPPSGSEAGDKVYVEGWPYGEGNGPEKQLNPKKKQWEMLQPGFYTTDDLVVAFDSSKSDMEDKSSKGELIVEGKGKCTVASLKGAIVR